jgi:hypothetical protein
VASILPDCEVPADRFNDKFSGYALPAILLVSHPPRWDVLRRAAGRPRGRAWHPPPCLDPGGTRLRWALVKLGLVGASALAVAVAYALLVSWWITPLVRATASGFDRLFFDVQGAVLVAYTVFAVALGILAGTVWRKTLAGHGS